MGEREFMAKLGANIRFYRTKCGLTQGELAQKVCKSLAGISKYERGNCAIDSYTLHCIAEAVGVNVAQLLPVEQPASPSPTNGEHRNTIMKNNIFYLFYKAYYSQEIHYSAIEIDWNTNKAVMYVDVKNTDDYRRCSIVLYGTAAYTSACTVIWATNPNVAVDYFKIVINGADWYMDSRVCHISYCTANWRSISSKGVLTLSNERPKTLESDLAFTSQELKSIKKLNQVLM